MKAFNLIAKIVVALAAVAGAVYLAATYGDRLVAWAKKVLGGKCCCCEGECDCECECCEDGCECECECECCEEAAEEVAEEVADETDVVAAEADFDEE